MTCSTHTFSVWSDIIVNNSLKQYNNKILFDSDNFDLTKEMLPLLTYLLTKNLHEKDTLKSVREFRKIGGLQFLLNLLNKSNINNDSEWTSTAIKILYFCCEDKSNCISIANEKTISLLLTILKSSNDDKILENILHIFFRLPFPKVDSTCGKNLIQTLVHILISKNDSNCEKFATALLIDLFYQVNGREDIVKHLFGYYNPLEIDKSIKVIYTLSKIRNDYWSEMLVEKVETVIGISNLFAYAENGDDKLQRASLKIIGSMAYASFDIFYDFIELGIIPIYMKQVRELVNTGCDDEYGILDDLELYCEDDVSRERICENGLETLLLLLNRWDNRYIVERVVEAFSFFISDDSGREKLLSLGLFSILITKLSECLKENKHQPTKNARELKTDWKIDAIMGTLLEFLEFELEDNWMLPFVDSFVVETLLEAIANGLSENSTNAVMIIITYFIDIGLESLITMQFKHKVISMLNNKVLAHSVDECVICNNVQFYKNRIMNELIEEAQSHLGMKTIDKILSEGNQSEKESAALMLPLILGRTARKYPQFFNICNQSLDMILQILAALHTNDNFPSCFICLIEIFTRTNNSLLEKDELDSCAFNSEIDKDVCFVLDDGQRVFANRRKVSKSDMFNVMLNGGFIEAKQSEISFGYASRDVFELIMHLLHGCDTCLCSELRNANNELLFDTANMADRMVLMEEKDNVLMTIVKRSTSCNIVALCEYAADHDFTTFLSLVLDHIIESLEKPVDNTHFLCIILNSRLKHELLKEIKKKIIALFCK